ncbi:MAG TPA: DUF1549 and DUF1553 domain-containing protein [Gemmataceae bacterium]|nr:DUF1549 and DUF1553 domain-containing protein [Gemmataceae bacterium]
MTRYATPFLALFALLSVALAQDAGKYADPELGADDRAHWAFKPPVRPAVPAVNNAGWVRTPIDAFISAKLEAANQRPLPEVDRLTLIRRVTLDLTGLPPTPAEVDAFLTDTSATAYEKVVERLLASPHFGERQASHWLDVVRFAESNGYELDADRPHAWRYRDYVVKSFNDDKPYDRFLTEQIAGDELAAGKNPRDVAELLVATGLHRCGQVHQVSGNLDADVLRQEVLTEMVNGLGSAVMGLTLGCARCHDHKFDPISAGDYYRLQAFFAATKYDDVSFASADEKAARKKLADDVAAKTAPIKKQIADIDAPYRATIGKAKRARLEPKYRDALDTPADKRTAEQKKLASDAQPLIKVSWEDVLGALSPPDREKRAALRERLHELEAQSPLPAPAAWAIKTGDAAKTFVLKRGDAHRKTAEVSQNFPRVLVSERTQPKSRLELARWLTRPEHPLTARVMVNRIWQSHFGRGIVASANDFGVKGERPTHPELLDWLAAEFVKPSGAKPQAAWGVKHIHRQIVLSATYRQAVSLQPDNRLLAGMNRRRLEAEAIRDSVLTAAGTLNRQVGGPSVKVPLEPEIYDLIFTEGEPDGLWPVTPDAAQHVRRSIYLFNQRNVRLPMLEAFDQPDTLNSCAVRPVSTFAPQALILMNGPFAHEQAKAMALGLVREGGNPIESLYRRAFGRGPTDAERRLALVFLKEQEETIRDRMKARLPIGVAADGVDVVRVRALADLCAVVYNTNEFVHIP